MRVLAGDIGGTKTSLAIFEVNGTKLESLVEKKYPSGDYSSLDGIVIDFVKEHCSNSSKNAMLPILMLAGSVSFREWA